MSDLPLSPAAASAWFGTPLLRRGLLALANDFENYSHFKPASHHEKALGAMLDQLISWSQALKPLRLH